jgi:hypothetical protein
VIVQTQAKLFEVIGALGPAPSISAMTANKMT